jgi:hypothetical protein
MDYDPFAMYVLYTVQCIYACHGTLLCPKGIPGIIFSYYLKLRTIGGNSSAGYIILKAIAHFLCLECH